MGKVILKNASVTVDSVDISDHCSKVTIETSFDDVDTTAFGAIYKEIEQGLGDGTITLTVFQDYDAGSIDDTLWPLSQSGAHFPVVVKPDAGAVSATNPSYTMQGVLLSYNPLDGEVGSASTTDVAIRNAEQSGIVRATS